jgi:RNA polymerase sigma factor (sigma-70 family)
MTTVPSFEEVFANYRGLCEYEANRYWHAFRQIHDLDDLVQEGYMGLWQAYETCNNWTTFPAYARKKITGTIYKYCHAYNHLIRVPKADKRYGHEYTPYETQSLTMKRETPNRLAEYEEVELDIPSPDVDADTVIVVRDILSQMPEQQARNLWAIAAEEWPIREYARRMNQHPNTVGQSVKRAKARFEKLWNGVPLSRQDMNACRVHVSA